MFPSFHIFSESMKKKTQPGEKKDKKKTETGDSTEEVKKVSSMMVKLPENICTGGIRSDSQNWGRKMES